MGTELVVPVHAAEVICGLVQESCRCVKPPHDGGAHECQCGGSWEVLEDGTFVYHSHPGSGDGWTGPTPDDYLPDFYSLFGL